MTTNQSKKTPLRSMPERILIVEGDKILITLIGNYVKNAGAKNVECVNDGVVAKASLESKDYDLIILDWRFKSPTGLQLYQMIRENPKSVSTPIILISGFVTKADLEIAQSDPNAKFLVKPFTEEILLKYITKYAGTDLLKDATDSDGGLYTDKRPSSKLEPHTIKGKISTASNERQKNPGPGNGFSIEQKKTVVASGDFTQEGESGNTGFSISSRESLGSNMGGKFAKEGSSSDSGFHVQFASPNVQGSDLTVSKSLPIQAETGQPSIQKRVNAEGGLEGKVFLGILDEGSPEDSNQEFIEVSPEPPEVVARRIVLSTESVLGKRVEVLVPRKALIADQDESLRTLLSNYLGELGSDDFHHAVNGEQAWQLINENEFDIILIDWRLKGLSGLNLYNRVRSKSSTKNVPLIVLTGFADKEDFRILGESPYSKFVAKPLNIEVFDETLRTSLRDATVQSAIKERVGAMLAPIMDDSDAIRKLIASFVEKVPRPQIYVAAMGEHLLANSKMVDAEAAFSTALRLDPNSVVAMTELSKIYHQTNRSEAAIKFLSKAATLSPENVERLCMIGEVGLNLQDPEQARIYFDKALNIDRDNQKASAGALIAKNMAEHLAETGQGAEKSTNFSLASSLNAVGITYIKNKQMDNARDQYKAAMNFIYDSPTMAKLQFNLGMAYLREKNLKDAYHWFCLARTYGGSEFEKANAYANKVGVAMGLESPISSPVEEMPRPMPPVREQASIEADARGNKDHTITYEKKRRY